MSDHGEIPPRVRRLLRAANAEIRRLGDELAARAVAPPPLPPPPAPVAVAPMAPAAASGLEVLIDRALDRLEAAVVARMKDSGGHEHKGKGPGGGQFTGDGGGESGSGTGAAGGGLRAGRRGKKARRRRKSAGTTTSGRKGVDTRFRLTKSDAPRVKDEARAERARATEKRSTLAVQRYAEKNEERLIEKVGGTQGTDSGAVDVVRRVGGRALGLEVKTIVNKGGAKTGSKAQIKCEPDQKARKEGWRDLRPDRRELHTVVFDDRNIAVDLDTGAFIGNREAWSGHRLYYRRGAGAYTLGGMYQVGSWEELRRLIRMPDAELPPKARAEGARPAKVKARTKSAPDGRHESPPAP